MYIITGIIMALVGMAVLIFNQQIYNFTGAIGFVESHFRGYSQAFIKLMGVVLVFLGIMFFTGIGGFITQPLGQGIKALFHVGGQ